MWETTYAFISFMVLLGSEIKINYGSELVSERIKIEKMVEKVKINYDMHNTQREKYIKEIWAILFL